MTSTSAILLSVAGAGIIAIGLCKVAARADDAIIKYRVIDPEPINLSKLHSALKGIEAWDGRSVGRAGERGPLQMKRTTWYDFSDRPHSWAAGGNPIRDAEAKRAETQYVLWLIEVCNKQIGRKPTPYMVGLIHNAGCGTVEHGRPNAHQRDFAQRVENLYYEKETGKEN